MAEDVNMSKLQNEALTVFVCWEVPNGATALAQNVCLATDEVSLMELRMICYFLCL
jgi:hypothetical protein